MDEATASIDVSTEKKIQSAFSKFLKNSTVITIAHRIKTILSYDRIIVLEAGNIIEFDTPGNLLLNKEGIFYSLYQSSVH